MQVSSEVQALADRYAAIEARLQNLQQAAPIMDRWHAVERRLEALEQVCSDSEQPSTSGSNAPAPTGCNLSITPDASPIQQRLEQELIDKGFSDFRFARVPRDYYDQPLEFRRDCLQAHSIDHLCKSMIMENTRAHPSVNGWSDPLNSKYYVVIVQYTARLNAEKLKLHIHKWNEGKVAKVYFNMRLAPNEVSDQLSGYLHNAVTPVGLATPLPIIMSHKIAALKPDFFFLGGGEVDLKVGFKASEFIKQYQPYVVDCTFD